MKTLAIHGHPTRGREVIEILEMLGGENKADLSGSSLYIYYIGCNNHIDLSSKLQDKFATFHLEEFLEKYPYKIGDLVNTQYYENTEIIKMAWDGNTIVYELHDLGLYTIDELQPYNKIIRKSECKNRYGDTNTAYINLNHFYYDKLHEIELIVPDNWEFKQKDGKMFGIRKQYPKTYGECSDILHTSCSRISIPGYRECQISLFQELLICRDAYWKIAGEELGLSEPWKPNFGENFIYAISAFYGTIQKTMVTGGRGILLFPTEEMRDAFYENFKFLIEKCKEFL